MFLDGNLLRQHGFFRSANGRMLIKISRSHDPNHGADGDTAEGDEGDTDADTSDGDSCLTSATSDDNGVLHEPLDPPLDRAGDVVKAGLHQLRLKGSGDVDRLVDNAVLKRLPQGERHDWEHATIKERLRQHKVRTFI